MSAATATATATATAAATAAAKAAAAATATATATAAATAKAAAATKAAAKAAEPQKLFFILNDIFDANISKTDAKANTKIKDFSSFSSSSSTKTILFSLGLKRIFFSSTFFRALNKPVIFIILSDFSTEIREFGLEIASGKNLI